MNLHLRTLKASISIMIPRNSKLVLFILQLVSPMVAEALILVRELTRIIFLQVLIH